MENKMQEIVNKLMEIIPHNINIMNNKGIIIASGDPARIGQLHPIALHALESNNQIAVYEENEGMLRGINAPFFFHGKPLGVIGISGEVDKIMAISQLVKVMAELLINQEYLMNTKQINEQIREQFLYEWSYRSEALNTDFINRGLALNIDVTVERCAAVVCLPAPGNTNMELRKIRYLLDERDYCIRLMSDQYVLFLVHNAQLAKKLKNIRQELLELGDVHIGVGRPEATIFSSIHQAQKAVRVGRLVYPDNQLLFFKDLEFYCAMVENGPGSQEALDTISKLASMSNSYLLETIIAYFQNNGEVNNISQALHIHRNSLDYRIRKIQDFTGKDLRNYKDLFYLYNAYISHTLFSEE